MQIDIQSRGFELTESLRDFTAKRLAYSLSHGTTRIKRVVVRLSDINGPKGGDDKRCHLELRLSGLPEIVIEETQSDLYAAVSRATERAGRTLARRIDQQQHGRSHHAREEKRSNAANE